MTEVRRIATSAFDWPASDGEAAELRRVVDAATAEDGAAPLDEAALLRLRHQGLDGSTLHAAGRPMTGFAWVHGDEEGRELALVVAPDARGRGIGTALVAEALAETDGALNAWSHGNHPAAAALAARFGFARVRDLWVMRRSLTDLPALDARPGVEVRQFHPGHDEEAFLALNAEAFAGHPEQGRMTRADLDQRMGETWFDPAGFFVAVATDPAGSAGSADSEQELLGFHWTKVHETEPPVGEVYVVGVSPRAQGGGLGRLLTLTGLHHLADRGLDQVLLFVEADNAPAIATYSHLGFTHADRDTHVQYRRTGSSSGANRE